MQKRGESNSKHKKLTDYTIPEKLKYSKLAKL